MGGTEAARDGYASVNGVRLHLREWGSPEAPSLLILHGLTGHAREFDGIARALAEDFHVIALDQRGHGASDPAPSYTPSVMADDLAAVVESLRLTGVRIVGHSMGGINGWHFAARYPDLLDRLVIIDVGPDSLEPEDVQNAWLEALEHAQRATYADPEDALNEYLAGNPGPAAEALRTFVHHNLRQREDGAWVWRYDTGGLKLFVTAAQSSADQWEALSKVTCPTLVLRAGSSGALSEATAARMASELPNAESIVIPESGHDIHIDQPAALLRELHRFLTVD